jgi:hypothetical protein
MISPIERNAGLALIIFTILMLFTMVMHPAGGGFEYLLKIEKMMVVTHSIALISIPFASVGFWGLSKRLGFDNFFSILGFAFAAFALIAVLMAAAANGLALPIFIDHYYDATSEKIETLKPILRYNFAFNSAFDYIYTSAFCIAILSWSIAILRTKKLSAWLAYFGIVIAIAAVILFFSGIAMNSLHGFRIFVTTFILWIVCAGASLRAKRSLSLRA